MVPTDQKKEFNGIPLVYRGKVSRWISSAEEAYLIDIAGRTFRVSEKAMSNHASLQDTETGEGVTMGILIPVYDGSPRNVVGRTFQEGHYRDATISELAEL